MPQRLAREPAGPDLDLVTPGCVLGRVDEVEPPAVAPVEFLPARAAVDVEVVPDDVDVAARVTRRDLLHEPDETGRGTTPAAAEHAAAAHLERREKRAR